MPSLSSIIDGQKAYCLIARSLHSLSGTASSTKYSTVSLLMTAGMALYFSYHRREIAIKALLLGQAFQPPIGR